MDLFHSVVLRIFIRDRLYSRWRRMCDSGSKALLLAIALTAASYAAPLDGCQSCHGMTDSPTMHPTGTVALTCVDCHGGDPTISLPSNSKLGSPLYDAARKRAHP